MTVFYNKTFEVGLLRSCPIYFLEVQAGRTPAFFVEVAATVMNKVCNGLVFGDAKKFPMLLILSE